MAEEKVDEWVGEWGERTDVGIAWVVQKAVGMVVGTAVGLVRAWDVGWAGWWVSFSLWAMTWVSRLGCSGSWSVALELRLYM